MVLKVFLFLLFAVLTAHSAKILGVFHFPSKSHHILGSTLLKALAKKGHHVTMLSPFPLETPMKNYEDIDLTGMHRFKDDNMRSMLIQTNISFPSKLSSMMGLMNKINHYFFTHPSLKKLISSNRTFDIVIQMWFGNNAFLVLPYIFNASSIVVSSIHSHAGTNFLMGNSAPYSYVPGMYPHFTEKMTFLERVANTLAHIGFDLIYSIFTSRQDEQIHQQYFANTPPLKELTLNVSLMLVNSHYSIESPRPYVPAMIQIGGFHIEEPKELQGDLKEYMDSSSNGVIFFSLGSNARSSDLSKDKLDGIVKCFQNVPLRVLWKFENEDVLNLPSNVKIGRWFPQRDILAHPNTKLFITHGGLLSTTEAVYHGVPMIGIPIFGDQETNVADGESKGYLIKLSLEDLSQDKFCDAVKEVLNNTKYSDNIKYTSRILRDQPLKPLDKAVYWIEYVLRHNGAHHLKVFGLKLHWYQYYLLDVIVFLVAIVAVVLGLIYYIIRLVCRLIGKLFKKLFTFKQPKTNYVKRRKTKTS